jgi:hypothetical protein
MITLTLFYASFKGKKLKSHLYLLCQPQVKNIITNIGTGSFEASNATSKNYKWLVYLQKRPSHPLPPSYSSNL